MSFNPELIAGLVLIVASVAAYCLTDSIEW